jgi:hypothetical protein
VTIGIGEGRGVGQTRLVVPCMHITLFQYTRSHNIGMFDDDLVFWDIACRFVFS